MIFRFWVRLALLLCVALSLLIGGTVIASGALRPVRFFAASIRSDFWEPIALVFETGEVHPLQLPGPFGGTGLSVFENQLAWSEHNSDLIVWSNGQRQRVGQTVSSATWSSDGQLAWREMVQDNIELRVWDGETTQTIAHNARAVVLWYWTLNNHLIWVQVDSNEYKQIMLWNGAEITELATVENGQRLSIYPIPCGAFFISTGSRHWIYQLNGTEIQIPESLSRFDQLDSDDCETFLFNNFMSDAQGDILWQSQEQSLSGYEVEAVRSLNEFVGMEIYPETVLVYQRANHLQTHALGNPPSLFHGLYFWEDPFTFWFVVRESVGQYLLQWNLATDDVLEFYLGNPIDIDVYAYDEVGHRAAWLGLPEPSEPSTFTLVIWENGRLSEYRVPINIDGSISTNHIEAMWMNDGNLMISLIHGRRTSIYRWDGVTLEPFAILPVSGIPLTDWMTWE